MTKLFAADTNILLDSIESLQDYKIVLLSSTLRELEKHKSSNKEDLKFRARQVSRYVRDNRDKFIINTRDYDGSKLGRDYDNTYEDNNILYACVSNGYGLITNDVLLGYKAEGFDLDVVYFNNVSDESDYYGVHEVFVTSSKEDQELLAHIYETPEDNLFNLVQHQYLFIWDKDKPTYNNDGIHNGYELIDSFKFDGFKLNKLKFKAIHSKFMGEKVKPINRKQEMLFDLLQNKDITIKACFGKYGVGKDFVMIQHALDLIEQGKIEKLIWARNNVELADVPTLGILPGDKFEKLVDFAMPLADHVGGVEGLEMLIRLNKIEIQHLGSLRGRDIKKSIIYVTECQNNTRDHIKLLIGRVGKESQLWLNGDLKQTDKEVYRSNSGIKALSKLKGNPLFGQVTLDKTERSETAELADLLD
ncbi:PhoH family protein [Metabacillus arenae]|uniref:PhoH family protein n=1 Tax=Metabacillus arenae TaxID=2771434 RepID=A0A926NJE0_9BACI|nr:PhoH family protein [Metabacillus arenae]MBD1379197.1 PhoH family protein [Metabacillus arenae]